MMPPGTLPEAIVLAFDLRLAAFATAMTVTTGVVIGLVPAWHAASAPLAATLNAGGRTLTRGSGALRTALGAGQVAVAVLLVSGATLLVRTLISLNNVDPGYHARNVLTMYVSLPITRYQTAERQLKFYQAVEREVGALPGVRAASVGGILPEDGWDIGQGFEIVGAPPVDEAHRPAGHYLMVGVRHFETFGIPLLRGRAFTAHDTASTAPVCIVNEEFVRRYLSGRDPIGVMVSVDAMDPGGPKPVVREIVGVSGQVKVEGPGEKENAVEIYVPIAQNTWTYASIAIQTGGKPLTLVPAVKAAIARVDKDQPVTQVRTMEEVAADATAGSRFRAGLVGAFATLGLMLAAVGIFSVLAFAVSQRRREFGIRIALGAQPADVHREVIKDGIRVAAFGVAAGLPLAAVLTRTLESLLYGVRPLDPLAFLAAPAVVGLTALLAGVLPALRAARVDPASLLCRE
jgi:putative ABC transport system permease protein